MSFLGTAFLVALGTAAGMIVGRYTNAPDMERIKFLETRNSGLHADLNMAADLIELQRAELQRYVSRPRGKGGRFVKADGQTVQL